MRRYQVKREGIEKLSGRLCPRIVQKLEAIGLEAVDCLATYAGEGMFEVTTPNNKQYVFAGSGKSLEFAVPMHLLLYYMIVGILMTMLMNVTQSRCTKRHMHQSFT